MLHASSCRFIGSTALVLAASLLSGTSCAPTDTSRESARSGRHTIVGGIPAQSCEYPATVALLDSSNDPVCTGTLVAPTVVVTAAHCLVQGWHNAPIDPTELRIVYGSDDPGSASSSERLAVAEVIPHPDYDDYPNSSSPYGVALGNDIGVVVLEQPIADAVTSAILDPSIADAKLTANVELSIAGYGARGEDWNAPSGLLYAAVVKYITGSASEFAAGLTGADTCWGDSGGPVYFQQGGAYYVVGATSRTADNATMGCGDKTIYTYLPYYLDWVQTVSGVALSATAAGNTCDAGDGGAGHAGAGGSAGGGGQAGADAEAGSGGEAGSAGEGGGAGAAGSSGSGGAAGEAGSAASGASGAESGGEGGGNATPDTVPTTTDSSDGGCGCSVPRHRRPREGLALCFALGALLLTRRRS